MATSETARSLGAVYTPKAIVDYLTSWAIQSPLDKVLEPSAGDGAFLRSAVARLSGLGAADPGGQVFAVELQEEEAAKARLAVPGVEIRAGDFFDLACSELPPMTVVVGNPPYVRFQLLSDKARENGRQRAKDQGVDVSGLASSWAHFVVHGIGFLDAMVGRLALVLPAELLQADYAEPIRALLLERFKSVRVLAFDERAFDPVLVDAVLLMADQIGPKGLTVVRVAAVDDLPGHLGEPSVPSVTPSGRWRGLLHQDADEVYQEIKASKHFLPLGDLASVDIGVVTGGNDFFVVSEDRRVALDLPREVFSPIVLRGRDLAGIRVLADECRWLLDLGSKPRDDPRVQRYLASGMDGVAKRYKTSQRRDWSVVPLPKHRGDLLLPYMHYHAPRLIFNPDRCWSTNLIHAVRLLSDATSPAALAGASLSSAFALSAEAEGRTYGGGVLKLETKEAERVLVPRLTKRKAGLLVEMFEQLDRLVRQGKYADASRQVDRFLGIPHDRLITARASYVTRRRSVGAKPRRKHAGATLPESSLPAAGDRSVDDDVSGSATERRTPRPRAIARSL